MEASVLPGAKGKVTIVYRKGTRKRDLTFKIGFAWQARLVLGIFSGLSLWLADQEPSLEAAVSGGLPEWRSYPCGP